MTFFRSIVGIIAPRAHAAAIEQLGSGAPGIDGMWQDLKSVFPHTDMGTQGLEFVLLMFTNIILRFIGGIAVLMIIYGGIRMIMTVGDENAHTEAHKIVMYACLGLILAIGADGIVMYVMSVVEAASGG
ncbi:MAG: hypothetical protein HOO67_01100 [Candidatus Peribacteraceae bacterium]|nr:hypothetical protein [Candidatus Peribacteraceae bacterium]